MLISFLWGDLDVDVVLNAQVSIAPKTRLRLMSMRRKERHHFCPAGKDLPTIVYNTKP